MNHAVKHLCALLLGCLLAACATRPPAPDIEALLHDRLFAPSRQAIDAGAIFALSDEMRHDAETGLRGPMRHDPRRELIDALYVRSRLGLQYDASVTRNAAEAYAARAGNCLSLVIMTAAFAKHLGLPVSYRSVLVDDLVTRQGDLFMVSGHVNLVLGRVPARSSHLNQEPDELTVDFLPPGELRGQRSLPLEERTIVAMYMNNRAAELLAQGRLDDGYAWAAAAVRHDPGFTAAINTLAVIYMRAGHAAQAEAALRGVLAREADNVSSLANLVLLLQREGRADASLAARLARLQPHPPFHFFDLGRQAMADGDYRLARQLFARELRRQPDQHEVHFWAAQAGLQLGDAAAAAYHLRQAMANSPTRDGQKMYAGKLDRLRARRVQ